MKSYSMFKLYANNTVIRSIWVITLTNDRQRFFEQNNQRELNDQSYHAL